MQKIVGYATWDSTPNVITFQTHALSFMDVLTGLSMKFTPEEIIGPQFLIVGAAGAALLQQIPMFVQRKPKPDGSLWSAKVKDEPNVYVFGNLARWQVLYDCSPEVEDKALLIAPKKGGDDKAFEITIVGSHAEDKPTIQKPPSP